MLKFTIVELELLSDYGKYIFIVKAIPGGIVTCVKRYAETNKRELVDL